MPAQAGRTHTSAHTQLCTQAWKTPAQPAHRPAGQAACPCTPHSRQSAWREGVRCSHRGRRSAGSRNRNNQACTPCLLRAAPHAATGTQPTQQPPKYAGGRRCYVGWPCWWVGGWLGVKTNVLQCGHVAQLAGWLPAKQGGSAQPTAEQAHKCWYSSTTKETTRRRGRRDKTRAPAPETAHMKKVLRLLSTRGGARMRSCRQQAQGHCHASRVSRWPAAA
jgi:hypothetical protein